MAPNTTEGTRSGAVILQRPDSGATSTSSINPGELLQLGFDPSDVNIEADGKDLVFEFPDGGRITVSGFFEVEDVDQLPRLELADGAELTGADFLAAFNPDLLTAAGPSAGSAQSQGSSEYSDDAGSMIDGISRLGRLGTDYWGRQTEVPDVGDSMGVERPMGSFEFNFGSDWGEGFQAVVYEDGQKDQHLYTKDQLGGPVYGQITFNASLQGTTQITQIRLSGFEPGTRIWIGDPDGDGYEVFADANGVVSFNYSDFTGPGVYFLPPENSDADMTINYQVDIRTNTSGTDTVTGSFDIIVDAVADKPENVDAVNDGTQYEGSVVVDGEGKEAIGDDGWSRNEMGSSGEGADTSAAAVSIPVTISAQFMDLDGSETHSLFIQAPGDGWECWVDGVKLEPVYDVPGHEGEAFYQIPSDKVSWDDDGNASADVVFTNDNEDMVSGDDWEMDLTVVAKAEENPTDREFDLDNNTATSEAQVTVSVDNINSSLTVNVGWASEGNNDAKHIGGESSEYKYGGKEGGATGSEADGTNIGAPIHIAINGAEGSAEFIQSIVFDYDGDRGTLYLNGQPVEPGQLLEFDGDITSLDLVFVPAEDGPQSYNSDDVDLSYTVVVGNEAGASAEFNGSSTIVIDAVADKAEEVEAKADDTVYDGTVVVDGDGKEEIGDDGWSRNEMQTGGESADASGVTVSIPMTLSAKFFDFDGSETHTLYIQAPDGDGWELWIDGQLIEPSFDVPGHEGEAYYQIPADKVDWSEDGTASVDVTFKNNDPDMTGTTDFEQDLIFIARAEETGVNDREYDSGNNVATEEAQVTVSVDNINSSLTVNVGWASEGNNDAKHIGGESDEYKYKGDEAGATGSEADGTNTGAPIHIEISGGEGSTEFIQSIVFNYSEYRGTLYLNGEPIEPGQVIEFSGDITSLDLVFVPETEGEQSYNSDDVDLTYTVVVGNEAGASATFNGSSTIVIDAVADKAEEVEAKADDTVYDGTVVVDGDGKEEIGDDGWSRNEMQTGGENADASGVTVSIPMTLSAKFFDFDGSETHTLYIQAPDGDGWELWIDGQLIEPSFDVPGHEGEAYYQIPADKVDWSEDGTASVDVTFTNNNPDMTGTTDFEQDLTFIARAEETGVNDREYDTGNNVATEEAQVTVSVDNINSTLNVNVGWASEGNNDAKHIGGDSNDYKYGGKEAGATGSEADGTNTGAPINIAISGGEGATESIQSIVFNYDASRGTLYDADNNVIEPGTVINFTGDITSLDYRFEPATDGDQQYNADDVDITYTVVVGNGTGATATFNGSSTIVIDAVADLADAELGDVVHPGLDEEGNLHLKADEATEKDGWFESHTSKDTPVSLSLDLSATFHDLDGSEYATILVALPNGVTVPLGEDGQPIYPFLTDEEGNVVCDADGNPYVIVSEGQVGGQDGVFDANEKFEIDLIFSEEAKDSSITVTVRTQEGGATADNREYDSGNDVANRDVTADIKLPWLSNAMTVRVGWASEGNQNNKHLENGDHDYKGYGSDATKTGVDANGKPDQVGAPIQVEFADSDYVEQVTFTYDPSQGTLLFNGMPINVEPDADGMVTIVINKSDFSLLNNMTFLPSSDYGDDDISLGYTVTVRDDNGNTFIIEGDTTIAIDAVADWTKMDGAEVSYGENSGTAGGEAITVTVEAHFKDTQDGSEDHYILIEYMGDDWTCTGPNKEQPVLKTVFYDADGNIMYPIGMENGEFVYDWPDGYDAENLPDGYSSQTYWAIKVDDYPEDGKYDVLITPPAQENDDTISIGVGTLVEEKNTSGNEYDYSNNQAWDIGEGKEVEINIDTIDGKVSTTVNKTWEDHQSNQHEYGQNPALQNPDSGKITITISDDKGTEIIDSQGSVRITFNWDGDQDDPPGTFTYNGEEYEPKFDPQTGSWTVTIPGSVITDDKSLTLRYNPPENDDRDLTEVRIEVDVKSEATGKTGTISGSADDVVVDAVADKPVDVSGDTEYNSNSGKAVISGTEQTVELNIKAEFGDYEDGSESHFLVISLANLQGIDLDNLPEGFTVISASEAGIGNYGDGYVIIQVSNEYLQEHGGKVDLNLDVVPNDVTDDTVLKVNFEAVAKEENTSGGEPDLTNNLSKTPGEAEITVHTITSKPTFTIDKAYENNTPNAHLGKEDQSDGASVKINVTGNNEVLTEVTITWNPEDGMLSWGGEDMVPGEHTFTSADGKTELTVTVTENADGTYSMNVVCQPEDKGITDTLNNNLTFKPSENFSDTDVTLSMEGTIKDTGSGETANFGPTEGTVIVDAVAQKPTEVESSLTYEGDNTAANETVDITVKATFRDCEDGSESHYILIEAKDFFDTSDYTVIQVGFTKDGVPLTPVYNAQGKLTGWLDPLSENNTYSATDKSITVKEFIQIEVDSVIQEFRATGESPEGWTVTFDPETQSYTVERTETVNIDKSGLTQDERQDVMTGAMSQDSPTDTGEKTINNNNAYEFDEDTLTIDVGIVTSEPDFSISVGNMFENLTPDANVGKDDKSAPPTMSLTGIDKGETAEISLTFGLKNGGELNGTELPDPYSADDLNECMYIKVTHADGTVEIVPLTPNGDGTWTAEFEVQGGEDATYSIEYYPGMNYNSDDLSVTYEVTVTDDASGDSKTWSNDPKYGEEGANADSGVEYQDNDMGIVVDAVAQQPDVSAEAGYGESDEGNAYTAFAPGKEITINVDVTFHDLDGSESHTVLIEAKTGWDLTDPVIIIDADGNAHKFSLSDLGYQFLNGTAYYTLELPEGFWDKLASGELTVQVGMTPPAGYTGSEESWKVGAITQEQHPEDGELRWDNNYSDNFGSVTVDFERLEGLSITNKHDVYEGDNSQAHLGEGGFEGGTLLNIGWPNPDNHMVEDISLSYDHGSIYCFPKGTDLDTIKQWLADGHDSDGNSLSDYLIESGKKYDQSELDGDLYYIADGTEDGDVTISIDGKVTNTNTGDYNPNSGNSTEIIVDAVAQKPEDLGGREEDGSYTISARFPDDDGSEDHFILVEAKAGGELTMGDLSSLNGDFEIYWHQTYDKDGNPGPLVPYYKVPTHDADGNILPGVTDNGNGSYSVNVTYDNAGQFKTGGLTTETKAGETNEDGTTNGELTYDNNTAITEGKTFGKEGGGGEPNDPDWGEWLYPSGPHHHDPHCRVEIGSAAENGTPNANIGINDYGNGDAKLVFGNGNGEMIVGYKTSPTDGNGNTSPNPGGVWCTPDYGPIESVTLVFDSSEAALIIDGQYVIADDPGGRWTVSYDSDTGKVTVTINEFDADLDIGLRPGSYGDAYSDPNGYAKINEDTFDLSEFHNNDDADISLEWSVSGTNNKGETVTVDSDGEVSVTVDAVAQGAESVEDVAANDYGHVFGKDADNQTAKITLKATFIDTDNSEQHYFLVEVVPGLSIDAETIYLDGTTYYRIPIDESEINSDGSCSKEIEVTFNPDQASSAKTPEPGLDKDGKEDGSDSYTLNYGTMSEEKNMGHDAGNRETDLSNNMSYNVDNSLEIKVSTVDSTVSVKIENAYENGDAPDHITNAGQITVNVNLDSNDVLDEFTISYNQDAGDIVFDQSAFEAMGVEVTVTKVDGIVTISFNGENAQEGWEELLKDGLTFSTEGNYSAKDAHVSWDAKVSDKLSGDTADFDGKQEVIVDAVAHGPEVSDVDTANENGFVAAESGGTVTVGLTLTFQDVGHGELHYAVMAYDGQWPCTKVLIYVDGQAEPVEATPTLMYDQNGNPFWAVQIEDKYLDDDTNSVRVEFEVKAPHSADDTDHSLKAGGISVEPFDQADKEITLDNNWSESLVDVPVNVAVATTDEVVFEVGTIVENDADGAKITLSQDTRDTLAANGEIVTETTLTFSFKGQGGFGEGEVVGTVIYDGKVYDVVMKDGTPTVTIDFGPNGYDEDKEFRIVWGEVVRDENGDIVRDDQGNLVFDFNHTGADVTVGNESTVQDTASGDTTTANGQSQADFDARADAPDSIEANAGDDVQAQTITFTVTADFVDTDGSEQHYILVECEDGWNGSYPVIEVDGKQYWQIQATPPNTNVTLTAEDGVTDGDYSFNVGGMAVEKDNGDTAYNLNGGSVTVTVGVVTADGVSMTMEDCEEDGKSLITFKVVGGDEHDELVSVTLSDLQGGVLLNADGTVAWDGKTPSTYTITDFTQDYYYQPQANASGDFTLNYTAKVQDANSGDASTKSFNGSGTVNVAPVTDTPIGLDGSASDANPGTHHVATMKVTFEADFVDMDGSEQHFFLVTLPDGIGVPDGWVALDPNVPADKLILDQCGLDGTVYRVEADGNGKAEVELKIGENYAGGELEFVAGSVEEENLKNPNPDYQFSDDKGTIEIPATGDINVDPTATLDSNGYKVEDALRSPDEPVKGKITMGDVDDDPVAVSGGIGPDGEAGVIQNGFLILNGQYGTLEVDIQTGNFTYTLYPDVELPADGVPKESFNVTVSDDHGGQASVDINVNIERPNTNPEAGDQYAQAGGGTEYDVVDAEGRFVIDDAEGDAVDIKGIICGDKEAVFDEATGQWKIEGEYGTLTMDADGNYTYTLLDEHSEGRDEFTVSFSDEFGAAGQGTLNVDVSPVNHAPVVDDSVTYFDGSGSFVHGSFSFSDVDMEDGNQGDSLSITSITWNGEEYYPDANGGFVIETDWGSLQMKADGSWVYTASNREEAAGADTWETFEVTVTDAGGLSSTGNLNVGLGNPAEPAPSSVDGIGIEGASADLSGLENLISAGVGSDILSATSGNDTFKWTLDDMPGLGDSYTDVIRDFNENGRDVLDLSDIGHLSADQLNAVFNGDGHFQISFTTENDGIQNIVIENINTTAGQDAAAILQDMITSETIKLNSGG